MNEDFSSHLSYRFLCHIEDIAENSCKSFTIPHLADELDIFIIKRNKQLYAYRNHCPHTGATLNWQPNVFLDYDNIYIQCAIHGARFEVETGLCIWGPCINQSLYNVDIQIIDQHIYFT